MAVILSAFLSILLVLGINCAVKELIRIFFSDKSDIIFYEYCSENDLEYDLRRIKMNYPNSKICIICNKKSADIIQKISEGFKNTEII